MKGYDYKEDIMDFAEEISQEKYNKEFYALEEDKQYECYELALQRYNDYMSGRADYYRDLRECS